MVPVHGFQIGHHLTGELVVADCHGVFDGSAQDLDERRGGEHALHVVAQSAGCHRLDIQAHVLRIADAAEEKAQVAATLYVNCRAITPPLRKCACNHGTACSCSRRPCECA